MPNFNNQTEIVRRTLNVFYVLDTSGSMMNEPIAQLNNAMWETVLALKETAARNADALLRIAVLDFNSKVKWMQPNGPEDVEDFIWEDLQAGGLTCVGDALKELNSKLSQDAFLNSIAGNYFPIIIFMSDGHATGDYKAQLDIIRRNRWFHRATKIGFALGSDPDLKMISEVVGNSEAVIRTDDLELFSSCIKFVSVTSSVLVSTSSIETEEEINNQRNFGVEVVSKLAVPPVEHIQYDPEPPLPEPDEEGEGWQ